MKLAKYQPSLDCPCGKPPKVYDRGDREAVAGCSDPRCYLYDACIPINDWFTDIPKVHTSDRYSSFGAI